MRFRRRRPVRLSTRIARYVSLFDNIATKHMLHVDNLFFLS